MSDLNVYLTSLVGSWDALASSHGDARVIRGQGFVAALFDSQPVFDNALLLEADDYDELRGCYPEGRWYATWTLADDTAARLRAAGQRLDTTTTAMVLQLDGLVEDATRAPLVRRVHPSLVAELNGLPADVLADVPGARAYATEDEAAGLVLIEVGTDVNASFVATRPEARRRGLATAALREARTRSQVRRLHNVQPPVHIRGSGGLQPSRIPSGRNLAGMGARSRSWTRRLAEGRSATACSAGGSAISCSARGSLSGRGQSLLPPSGDDQLELRTAVILSVDQGKRGRTGPYAVREPHIKRSGEVGTDHADVSKRPAAVALGEHDLGVMQRHDGLNSIGDRRPAASLAHGVGVLAAEGEVGAVDPQWLLAADVVQEPLGFPFPDPPRQHGSTALLKSQLRPGAAPAGGKGVYQPQPSRRHQHAESLRRSTSPP